LEESLDVEMVSAICPNCHIVLVEANTSHTNDLGKSVNTAVDIMHANVISNSYIRYNVHGKMGRMFYEHQGVIITAAAGDEGYKIGEPAGFNTVVSVGGTALTRTTTGRKWTEAVCGGTGSGCVVTRLKPAWQNNHACKYRAMNDVAAVAAPYTGVAYYDTYNYGGWGVAGGTSTATPIIASIYALAGNAAKLNAAESLYAKGASLYDVTSGQNGTKCATHHHPLLCAAAPGWDGPTGNGTPNGISAF
jgi:subtilase family serine protease